MTALPTSSLHFSRFQGAALPSPSSHSLPWEGGYPHVCCGLTRASNAIFEQMDPSRGWLGMFAVRSRFFLGCKRFEWFEWFESGSCAGPGPRKHCNSCGGTYLSVLAHAVSSR